MIGAAPAWAASPTDAQPDSSRAAATPLVRALDEIHLNSRVRVEASDSLLEGMLAHWDAHPLRLHAPAQEKEMPLTSVQGLWVHGRGTGRGAKVGAITLGIAGATLVGALAGGATGALVGAGIGAAFPMWHRRFP